MHLPTWGTLVELTASELGISEGDDFEILVGDGGARDARDGRLGVEVEAHGTEH
jgi:hypothetical protein